MLQSGSCGSANFFFWRDRVVTVCWNGVVVVKDLIGSRKLGFLFRIVFRLFLIIFVWKERGQGKGNLNLKCIKMHNKAAKNLLPYHMKFLRHVNLEQKNREVKVTRTISVANITWRENYWVTHIMSIIKKERVYYLWNVYKITFFYFSGEFSV